MKHTEKVMSLKKECITEKLYEKRSSIEKKAIGKNVKLLKIETINYRKKPIVQKNLLKTN